MTAMIVWTIRQTQGPLRGKNGSYDSPTPGPLRVIVPLKIPYFYRNDEVLRNPIFFIFVGPVLDTA